MGNRIYRRLTARSLGMSVMLNICAVIIVGGIFALLFLAQHFFSKSDTDFVIFLVLVLFYVGLFAVYMTLITRRIKHTRDLKIKLEKLMPDDKQHVVSLATNYRGPYIKLSDRYLYGNMSFLTGGKVLGRNVIGFEYLSLKDIAWVYYVNPVISPMVEATIVGACTGLILGTVMRDTPREYVDLEKYVYLMKFPRRSENKICIFLRDGSCYRGVANTKDYDMLRNAICAHNPSCKFGFDQEVLREFTL